MEDMGLKLTPLILIHLLGPLGMFEPMAGTSDCGHTRNTV